MSSRERRRKGEWSEPEFPAAKEGRLRLAIASCFLPYPTSTSLTLPFGSNPKSTSYRDIKPWLLPASTSARNGASVGIWRGWKRELRTDPVHLLFAPILPSAVSRSLLPIHSTSDHYWYLRIYSNNLLYPEVDRSNHVLLYSCRNCSYKEEARQNIVFKNDLKSVTKVRRDIQRGRKSRCPLLETTAKPSSCCSLDRVASSLAIERSLRLTILTDSNLSLSPSAQEQPGVIDSIRTDPTLPRRFDHVCPECGHSESVYFQDQSKRIHNRMILL